MVQASRAHGQSQSLSPRTLHGTPRLVQHPAPSPCVLGEHKLGCAVGSELCVTIDACKADPDVCALRVELFTGTVCLECLDDVSQIIAPGTAMHSALSVVVRAMDSYGGIAMV